MGRLFITAELAIAVLEGRKVDTYRPNARWWPRVEETFGFTIGGRPDVCKCLCTGSEIVKIDTLDDDRRAIVTELLGEMEYVRRVDFRLQEVCTEAIRTTDVKAIRAWMEKLDAAQVARWEAEGGKPVEEPEQRTETPRPPNPPRPAGPWREVA